MRQLRLREETARTETQTLVSDTKVNVGGRGVALFVCVLNPTLHGLAGGSIRKEKEEEGRGHDCSSFY